MCSSDLLHVPDTVTFGRFLAHGQVDGHGQGKRCNLSPDHTIPVPPHSPQHFVGCGAGAGFGEAPACEKASHTATVAAERFIRAPLFRPSL